MPGKPSFTRVDMLDGIVQVGGQSDEEPPFQVHVTLLQEPHAAGGTLESPPKVWQADLPSDGFQKGPCVVVGHEIAFTPNFSAHTWIQYMKIK